MKNKINSYLLITIISIVGSFFTKSNAQSIVGTWAFDDLIVTVKEDAVEAQKKNFESQREFTKSLREQMKKSNVILRFNEDGSLEQTENDALGNPQKETGSWKIEDDTLFMNQDPNEGNKYKITEGKLLIMHENSGTIKTFIYIAK